MRKLISFFKRSEGAAVIETAILFPVLLLMLWGIVSFGRYYWIKTSVQNSVMAAGRYAMLHATATDSQVTTIANQNITGIDPNSVTYTITTSTNADGVTLKTIAASHNFYFFGKVLSNAGSLTIQRSITVPMVP